MSKIEDAIAEEKAAVVKKAELKAQAARISAAKKWSKWVEEEKPRIAAFRKKLDKEFPCLVGDYGVKPRATPGYTDALFVATVTVKGMDLRVQETRAVGVLKKGYVLVVPDWQYRNTNQYYDLKGNSDLRERIKNFIQEREAEEQRVQDCYDRMPMGNTD